MRDDEDKLLKSVAVRNAHSVLIARQRAEQRLIDEREALAKKTEQLESSLRLIIDTVPEMLATALPDGSVDYVNQRWLDYYGRTLEDLRGWNWKGVIHPEDEPVALAAWAAAVTTGNPLDTKARVRRADGQYRWIVVRGLPLRDDLGEIVRWYVSAHDIHEQIESRTALERAFDEIKKLKNQLQRDNLALNAEVDKAVSVAPIIGTSVALQRALSRLHKVARTNSTVLITGETGTGKERFARMLHEQSQRSARPFVAVNCAAIPPSLVATELFGHEKGAFTGASQQRPGRFEVAKGGTIFLDEVGELTLDAQIAFLRVLEEGTFERVGGHQSIRTDVRVIAASNRNLETAITCGTFRADLFHRLNVFPIQIPPLRERKEDIPLLVKYFIDLNSRKSGKKTKRVSSKTMELLESYDWPGNIRELRNVVERSLLLSGTEEFSIDESWRPLEPLQAQTANLALKDELNDYEKDKIEDALRKANGRVSGPSGAAAKLGIPASTLDSKIKSLKINKGHFKNHR